MINDLPALLTALTTIAFKKESIVMMETQCSTMDVTIVMKNPAGIANRQIRTTTITQTSIIDVMKSVARMNLPRGIDYAILTMLMFIIFMTGIDILAMMAIKTMVTDVHQHAPLRLQELPQTGSGFVAEVVTTHQPMTNVNNAEME